MKRMKHYTLFAFCFSVYIGCAKVQFSDVPAEGGAGVTPGAIQTGTKDGGKKAVDILFVVDNSASMSTEQASMASRFTNFIATLNSAGLDYRIGIITTDISDATSNPPRAINQNGALQDGKLVAFPNGSFFLTPATPNINTQFNSTIQRQETANCEAFLSSSTPTSANYTVDYLANCPSGDERGIYAANMFLMNNSSAMIRPEAHLAVIFLADEDERSRLYSTNSAYALATLDQPTTLISNLQTLGSGKSFAVHSIIVKPGDSACKAIQDSQMHNVKGSYGDQYAQATSLTGGILGDVCAADYTSQLNNIGYNITAHVNEIELGCANPEVISVEFNPVPGAPTWTLQGSKIVFSSTLPVNMVVNYSWRCNKVQ